MKFDPIRSLQPSVYAPRHLAEGVTPKAFPKFRTVSAELPMYHNKALWVVYGPKSFPQVMCCQITKSLMGWPNIWGLYKPKKGTGRGRFTAIGASLAEWRTENPGAMFFASQREALSYLGYLTSVPEFFLNDEDPVFEDDDIHRELLALNDKTRQVYSWYDKVLMALGHLNNYEIVLRVFFRVRARLVYLMHYQGRTDNSIAHLMGVDPAKITELRTRLNIDASQQEQVFEAQEEDEHGED